MDRNEQMEHAKQYGQILLCYSAEMALHKVKPSVFMPSEISRYRPLKKSMYFIQGKKQVNNMLFTEIIWRLYNSTPEYLVKDSIKTKTTKSPLSHSSNTGVFHAVMDVKVKFIVPEASYFTKKCASECCVCENHAL